MQKIVVSITADNFMTLQAFEEAGDGNGMVSVKLNRDEALKIARDMDKLARMLPIQRKRD